MLDGLQANERSDMARISRVVPKTAVVPKANSIEVAIDWCGRRYRPRLSWKPTAANLKAATTLWLRIQDEIAAGRFHFAEHFPNFTHLDKIPSAIAGGSALTYENAFQAWVKLHRRDWRDSTLQTYLSHHKEHWGPLLGSKRLENISEIEIAEYLTQKSLSPRTENNVLVTLRGVFEYAVQKGWVGKDPTAFFKNKRFQKEPPDPFHDAEVERILTALAQREPVLADYFEFAFFTGLRTAEQIALRWADVDLTARSMRINHTRVRGHDQDVTKTGKVRDVELVDRALAVLHRQQARTRIRGQEVFLQPEGGNWDGGPFVRPTQVYKPFAAVLKRLGIRHRPAYQTRATNISRLLGLGADPWWVAQQHGHDLATMLKHYAKWLPNADQGRNLDRVNRLLSSGSTESLTGS